MMKAWDRGDALVGAASRRTRLKRLEVVGETGDDHFHNFVWEAAGQFVRSTCRRRRVPG